jgi:Protein of unknown function (DUF3089)
MKLSKRNGNAEKKDPSVYRHFLGKKSIFLLLLPFFLLENACKTPISSKLPTASFDVVKKPTAPNYADLKNWAAHPVVHDFADSIPLNSGLTDAQATAQVDVFFVHPTTFTLQKGVEMWNGDLTDQALNDKTDKGSILFQASIFNGAGRIFAPRYRQAYYGVYVSPDSASNRQALALAYEDVKASFEFYLKNWNNGRPIIIAAHSQGTQHAGRLLKEFFEGKPLKNRLVVAYLVGMPVSKNLYADIKPCDKLEQTGCFCSWRTFLTGHEPKKLQYGDNISVVNPLSMTTQKGVVSAENHQGSVLIGFKKAPAHNVSTEIHMGILWTTKPKFRGSFFYRTPNYHIADYNLFYFNVREDANRRVGLFWKG